MKKLVSLILALMLILLIPVEAWAAENDLEAVRSLIKELPTVEEFQAMDQEAQLEAYNRTQAAYDAFEALNEEEKARISEAEAVFESLFSYFNTLIAPLTDAGETEVQTISPTETVKEADAESVLPTWWIGAVSLIAAFVMFARRKK